MRRIKALLDPEGLLNPGKVLDISPPPAIVEDGGAGWSSLVARRAHNPKVAGSNPAPATKPVPGHHGPGGFASILGVHGLGGARKTPSAWYKAFRFRNFREALAFAHRVGELAERENHHPRLTVEWGKVTVEWWTHTAGGITEKDREMARLTEALLE